MRRVIGWFGILILMGMLGCQSKDPIQEIQELAQSHKVGEAKRKFRDLVEKRKNANLDREYIQFLFQYEQYRDFDRESKDFLGKYPDDKEVRNLQFSYYEKLATTAEAQQNYEDEMYYIVNYLLSPDYQSYRKWESRQTSVFQKWYNKAKDKDDQDEMKRVITQMKNLNFDNLAQTLDPQLYAELGGKAQETEKNQPE